MNLSRDARSRLYFPVRRVGVILNKIVKTSMLVLAAGIAAPAQADFSFSPRFFLYFDNASQRQSGFDELASLTEAGDAQESAQLTDAFGTPITVTTDQVVSAGISNQMVYPLFGGAVTYGFGQDNRTNVTFSALYGKAKSRFKTLQTFHQTITAEGFAAEDISTQTMEGDIKTRRLDLELSLQHRLNERFALLGGFRYEHLSSKGNFDFDSTSSNNAVNLFQLLFGDGDIELGLNNAQGTMSVKSNDNLYSVRFGGAAFTPIGKRNTVYVNGLVHITHESSAKGKSRFVVPELDIDETGSIKVGSETTIGPDIAVGYQHRFSDRVGFDIRYRGIFYFPISGTKDFTDPRVNHGLNAGVTFGF